MSSQIFKSEVPKDVLFNFLDNICIKNEKNYILNSMAFKKGLFNESIVEFFKSIYQHYHNSKKKYYYLFILDINILFHTILIFKYILYKIKININKFTLMIEKSGQQQI